MVKLEGENTTRNKPSLLFKPILPEGTIKTAVPFSRESSQIPSSLSPIRDHGPKRINLVLFVYCESGKSMKQRALPILRRLINIMDSRLAHVRIGRPTVSTNSTSTEREFDHNIPQSPELATYKRSVSKGSNAGNERACSIPYIWLVHFFVVCSNTFLFASKTYVSSGMLGW